MLYFENSAVITSWSGRVSVLLDISGRVGRRITENGPMDISARLRQCYITCFRIIISIPTLCYKVAVQPPASLLSLLFQS